MRLSPPVAPGCLEECCTSRMDSMHADSTFLLPPAEKRHALSWLGKWLHPRSFGKSAKKGRGGLPSYINASVAPASRPQVWPFPIKILPLQLQAAWLPDFSFQANVHLDSRREKRHHNSVRLRLRKALLQEDPRFPERFGKTLLRTLSQGMFHKTLVLLEYWDAKN